MAHRTRVDGIVGTNDNRLVTLTIAQLRALVAPPADSAPQPQPPSDHRGHPRSIERYHWPLEDPRRHYDHRERFHPRSRTPPDDRSRRARSPPASRYDIQDPRARRPYSNHRSRSRSPPSTRLYDYDNRGGLSPRGIPVARDPRLPPRRPNPTASGYECDGYIDYRRQSPHAFGGQATPDPGRREVRGPPVVSGPGESPAPGRLPVADCYRPGLQIGGPRRWSNQPHRHQRRQTRQVVADPVPNVNAPRAVEIVKATEHSKNKATTSIAPQEDKTTGELNPKSGGRQRRRPRGDRTSDIDNEGEHRMATMTLDVSVKVETPSPESKGNHREQNEADVLRRAEELRTQIKAGRRQQKAGGETDIKKHRLGAN